MAKLVFFGTPEFAVPSLEALLRSEHEVALVVCQPDRKAGRGKKLQKPPVKVHAEAAGIAVMQPETLMKGTPSGEAFFEAFTALKPDLGVVAAYGRILSTRILKTPTRGFVNVHGSLLPRWRGAAPVQRAIAAGDTQTGVCLMDMVYALDAGDVYAAEAIAIEPDDTGASLTQKVSALGAGLLSAQLNAILLGEVEKSPQPLEGVNYANMLKKSEAIIDFKMNAADIDRQVRAMAPWPGSQTSMHDQVLKVFSPRVAYEKMSDKEPGTVLEAHKELFVQTGEGVIAFGEVQFPNKRRMSVEEFLRGNSVEVGTPLGRGAL